MQRGDAEKHQCKIMIYKDLGKTATISTVYFEPIFGDKNRSVPFSPVKAFGIALSVEDEYAVEECDLLSAFHSKNGVVMEKLRKVDGDYTKLERGDELDLAFSAPDPRDGLIRDFALVSTGYYIAEPGGVSRVDLQRTSEEIRTQSISESSWLRGPDTIQSPG